MLFAYKNATYCWIDIIFFYIIKHSTIKFMAHYEHPHSPDWQDKQTVIICDILISINVAMVYQEMA